MPWRKKNVLSFCLKSLVVQADLMSTVQSRGAAAMKDRSPMVTFVKTLKRIPLLFPCNGMAVRRKLNPLDI